MTLNQITKVKGPGIHTQANIVSNSISLGGIATASNFKTGTTNVHNVGVEAAGINVLGADTPIGTGATIYDAGGAVFTGVVTATKFVGQADITGGSIVGTSATFTGNVSIGGTLTYEDVTNIDSVGLVTARTGLVSPYADIDDFVSVGSNIHLGNAGVVTATSFVGGLPITNGADNRVITASSASAIQGEANLTFDGTTLTTNGTGGINISQSGSDLTMNSAGAIFTGNGGNATNPIVANVSDTNTGFFYPAADTIAVTSGGSERIRINSSGHVKIGSGSATGIHNLAKVLEISGGDGGDLIIGNDASGNIGAGAHIGAIAFKNIDTSTGTAPHYAGIRCEATDTAGNMDLRFYTGVANLEADTPQVIINNIGNTGIGTNNPLTKFVVSNDGAEGLEVSHASGTVEANAYNRSGSARSPFEITARTFKMSTGNPSLSVGLCQDSAGKVGIGEDSPDELLHIASTGTAKFRLTDNRTSISDGSQYGVIQFEQRDSNTPGVSVEVAAVMQDTSNGNTALQFKTGTPSTIAERLRITGHGKVAIGNVSPQQLLHVWPDTANTTSAYVRVTAGDRNSNTGIDIGHDASGNGQVNVVSNGTLTFSTNNSPRIKIANNSAATAIGTNAAYNAMLTVRGDISGSLLTLKATEDTNRFVVSGNDTSSCEVNLYDANGTQQVVLGTSTGASWLSQVQNNYFYFKTNNTERLRILADGGTRFTRLTTGGAETVGNDPGKWFKIGTWSGSTVDAAARATITVIGAATHDSNSNVSGETKIHLAFSSNPTLFGYFYSTTAVREGVAGVAHKYNSGSKSAEIWIKYREGYSSTACNADVTNGFFAGENTNTGSTSTPSGATLLESWWSVWTSDQTTSTRKLEVDGSGAFKHSPLGSFNEPYLKSEGNSSTYIQKIQKNGAVDTNLQVRVQNGGSLKTLLYLKGSNKTVGIGPDITPARTLHVQEHMLIANKGTNGGQPYVSSTPTLAVGTDGSNVVPSDTTYRHNALVSFGVGGHNAGNPASNSYSGACPALPYFKLDLYGQTGVGDVGTNLDSTFSMRSINPNNTRLRIRTKDNYNGSYPDASISFVQQQSTEIARIECDTHTGAANMADLAFYTNYGGLYERVRITKTGEITFNNQQNTYIKTDGANNHLMINTEGKEAVRITQSQVLSTAKSETKVLQFSGLNSRYWNDNSVKRFYLNYYTGSSSATYHVARMISQTDWGFENIEVKVGKYQYSYSNTDLHTQRFRAYYGGHYNQVINYNQQAGGSGTSTEGCLQMRSDFGPGGSHTIHQQANGGYYRDCYGSDIYIQLGVYEGFRLEFTIWANCGLYDTGDYANAYAFYPANFQGQATQSNANSWNGPRGLWVNTSSNGTGTGSNPGVFKFTTGANYGQVSAT